MSSWAPFCLASQRLGRRTSLTSRACEKPAGPRAPRSVESDVLHSSDRDRDRHGGRTEVVYSQLTGPPLFYGLVNASALAILAQCGYLVTTRITGYGGHQTQHLCKHGMHMRNLFKTITFWTSEQICVFVSNSALILLLGRGTFNLHPQIKEICQTYLEVQASAKRQAWVELL